MAAQSRKNVSALPPACSIQKTKSNNGNLLLAKSKIRNLSFRSLTVSWPTGVMRWPALCVGQKARALHLLKGVSFELSSARSDFSELLDVATRSNIFAQT